MADSMGHLGIRRPPEKGSPGALLPKDEWHYLCCSRVRGNVTSESCIPLGYVVYGRALVIAATKPGSLGATYY